MGYVCPCSVGQNLTGRCSIHLPVILYKLILQQVCPIIRIISILWEKYTWRVNNHLSSIEEMSTLRMEWARWLLGLSFIIGNFEKQSNSSKTFFLQNPLYAVSIEHLRNFFQLKSFSFWLTEGASSGLMAENMKVWAYLKSITSYTNSITIIKTLITYIMHYNPHFYSLIFIPVSS